MKHIHKVITSAVLILGISTTTFAVPITMNFTFDDFFYFNYEGNPFTDPIDPISGTVVWDAESVHDDINHLISIDLTINSYMYSLDEVGYEGISTDYHEIGGTVNSVNGMDGRYNDFYMSWNPIQLAGNSFAFISPGVSGFRNSNTCTSFSVTGGAAVPEPNIIFLFGVGLIGLVGLRGFKKR